MGMGTYLHKKLPIRMMARSRFVYLCEIIMYAISATFIETLTQGVFYGPKCVYNNNY